MKYGKCSQCKEVSRIVYKDKFGSFCNKCSGTPKRKFGTYTKSGNVTYGYNSDVDGASSSWGSAVRRSEDNVK